MRSINPVVAETDDGYRSDIRARPIIEAHVLAALHDAADDLPAEGAVGAGTSALGFTAASVRPRPAHARHDGHIRYAVPHDRMLRLLGHPA